MHSFLHLPCSLTVLKLPAMFGVAMPFMIWVAALKGMSFFTLVVVMLDGVDFADILEDLLVVGILSDIMLRLVPKRRIGSGGRSVIAMPWRCFPN